MNLDYDFLLEFFFFFFAGGFPLEEMNFSFFFLFFFFFFFFFDVIRAYCFIPSFLVCVKMIHGLLELKEIFKFP